MNAEDRTKRCDRDLVFCVLAWTLLASHSALGAAGPSAGAAGTQPDERDRQGGSTVGAGDASNARGRELFLAHWVPEGSPVQSTHVGLGPLYNADACDACHPSGGHGSGPSGDGPVPDALVLKLKTSSTAAGAEAAGDPVYGHVLNTHAVAGLAPEGVASVRYRTIGGGYYPSGGWWRVRSPVYSLSALHYGALAASTVIMPRIAPSLRGLGQLALVPESAIAGASGDNDKGGHAHAGPAWHFVNGERHIGRFGWQGNAVSIRAQAAAAFADEMGITSPDRGRDDCTAAQVRCFSGGEPRQPEITDDDLAAVANHVRSLEITPQPRADPASPGARTFQELGCAQCHRRALPVVRAASERSPVAGEIEPYTDLSLHDLGAEMADRNVAGKPVPSRWRTAPLWGLSIRLATEPHPTFLHDARAESLEEAILWHLGEAAPAQARFKALTPGRRELLLAWLSTL